GLTRGPRLAGGKTGPRNLAEHRASDDIAWRAEIRLVEQVENVSPQPPLVAPGHRHTFADREIGAAERRTDHGIAAERAEAGYGYQRRRIEPLVHRADDRDRSGAVGAHGVRQAVERTVARDDVERIAALRLDDGRQLPAARQRVPAERKFVGRADDESVPGVEIGPSALVGNVVTTLDGEA